MDMHDLLIKPIITEKTTMMMSDGKYISGTAPCKQD